MKAKIFYLNNMTRAVLMNSMELIFKDVLEKQYTIVAEIDENKIQDHNKFLEYLFDLFNGDNNPLTNEDDQKYIAEKMQHPHTSMSVGDLVMILDEKKVTLDLYRCETTGWKKIKLEGAEK